MSASRYLLFTGVVGLTACGTAETPTTPDPNAPPNFTYSLTIAAGDGQEVRVNSAPETPIRVRLARSDGAPVSGAALSLAITSGGGQLSSASVTTDAGGEAIVAGWTVGGNPGANTLSIASPAHSVTASVGVTARWPLWTVMVYLAADNNLALPGLIDLEEMEAAGFDPEVQVVVQAEFSPGYLGLYGVDHAELGLTSWDTFRYAVGPNVPTRLGPDGPVSYLGPTDMTRPETLRDFVQWARATYPSEREVLVPWNHGGGYTGLIQDLTQRGSYMMPIDEFRTALVAEAPFDIIDFDMCLMGGYETLLSVFGLTDIAIFSEELVPGDGNPYQAILQELQTSPRASTQDVARMFVDEYTDEYLGGRSSTTKSAYALGGLDALDAALVSLAAALTPQLSTIRSQLQAILGQSQKFSQPELTDIADLVERLPSITSDGAVLTAVQSVLTAANDPAFRIANRGYSAPEDRNVDRASGLHIVFPSGLGSDVFDDQGRRSLADYRSSYPSSPWGGFLEVWTSTLTAAATTDLGTGRGLEIYEVWDQGTVTAGADVDFWILEPDGRLSVPWYGTVTTNGVLSGDSYQADPTAYYEGWLSRQVIQSGEYKIYAHLWTAPENHQTSLDVAFRLDAADPFTLLYDPSPMVLSAGQRIEDDLTPTLAEADAGAYTNFRWVAVWDVGASGPLRAPGLGTAPALTGGPESGSPQLLDLLARGGRGR